jgi:hypothetical protein
MIDRCLALRLNAAGLITISGAAEFSGLSQVNLYKALM